MYGKIIDLPIKPVLDLMKKGNKASKKKQCGIHEAL